MLCYRYTECRRRRSFVKIASFWIFKPSTADTLRHWNWGWGANCNRRVVEIFFTRRAPWFSSRIRSISELKFTWGGAREVLADASPPSQPAHIGRSTLDRNELLSAAVVAAAAPNRRSSIWPSEHPWRDDWGRGIFFIGHDRGVHTPPIIRG